MFQFLIGTIKTVGIGRVNSQKSGVSIPYRYYKNEENLWLITLNTRKFQFLIGTIKTARDATGGGEHSNVSIPYRYYKNA